jgi:molecular chaperone DnaK (HSP70)
MTARFSIGIDLGTTNSVLAYVPLTGDASPEALAIPQWETLSTRIETPTLPSFLFLPEDAADPNKWVVGRLARRRSSETPGRVVRSAKSWLCHHAADRSAPILPWGSEDLAPAQKISPVQAASYILNYLRSAWDSRFAQSGCAFGDQEITITVPASFDAAAQRLTLNAAEGARYPAGVRLLEEPQAAFYCWLERHGSVDELWASSDEPKHVLIIDIGGGTSDFSLFELRPGAPGDLPRITRVAVSEHILLGGDNIDLALAVRIEPRLAGDRGEISGPQWEQLVASCRDLKERALAGATATSEQLTVVLPGRGSGLMAGTRTATMARDEAERLVLDGFFPACDANARPYRAQTGLRDWGLPYAADSAMSHHLADFLRERPRVDAVLFNGGSLHSPVLRQRLLEQIAAWSGKLPLELENSEPELAVALGAARFGKLLHGQSGRIAAGAAHAVFLQVQTARGAADQTASPALVCVLPRNAPAEELYEIDLPGLEVRTDQLVSFQACSSTRHGRCQAGDVLPFDSDEFRKLPPLQTIIRTARGADAGQDRSVPVRLLAKTNALGLLQISCASRDPKTPQSWPLEFNLRPHEQGGATTSVMPASAPIEPNAAPQARRAARDHVTSVFSRPAKGSRLTANAILKGLERILGLPRHEWNAALVRNLWPALHERTEGRRLSVEHEEAWLTLAGFLLRPGFGFGRDELRMDELWKLRDAGLCFPSKRSKVQEYILWRRVAGGLTAERQETLLARELVSLRAGRASPELVRLAGSLERLSREIKIDLIQMFISLAQERMETKQHCAPYLTALGLLLNRVPLYGGPGSVVVPDFVARAYSAFHRFDWSEPELLEMHNLFLRAARVVDDRNLDVPKSLRTQIARKLEDAGVAPLRTATLRAFTPIGRTDSASLYGEALPPGLLLDA